MPPPKRNVVLGLLGPVLDNGRGPSRWETWRPTVAICQQPDFLVDRFELLFERKFAKLGRDVAADLKTISPETTVRTHEMIWDDAWDFEAVYGQLLDFAKAYPFKPDEEEYLVHITTGSHVAQICWFLLTESRYLPAKLLQTVPPPRSNVGPPVGSMTTIDLDLSKYDRLASRFATEARQSASLLKSGIDTRCPKFNALIDRIERVVSHAKHPVLLTGPTGAGKTLLARRIYELKKTRRQIDGAFVEVNCATLRGDGAASALFGHVRGSFTGAMRDRPGLLRAADGGLLFLDEIGELGVDEQAMLLRALEEKRFLPLGADKEARSDFQLIAGTNRDLGERVASGAFREDLLARINLWTFDLPPLRERREDIEPNLRYELEQFATQSGSRVRFNKEAETAFLAFALSGEAAWAGNFRDLNAAVTRMATLAAGGRVTVEIVADEIERLRTQWKACAPPDECDALLEKVIGATELAKVDRFDRVQLAEVIRACREARTLSDAGRALFSASRAQKQTANDADRLRKYLARFHLDWRQLRG